MNPATLAGFGDSATWPACTGHPCDPRTDDSDDVLTEDDAMEEAEHRVTCSPASVIWHLNELCGSNPAAVPLPLLFDRDFDPADATADELLVVMLHGSAENCNAARIEMIDRLKAAMKDDIKREAAELLEADAKAREQEEA